MESLVIKSLTVKVVFSMTGTDTLEVGDVSTQLLDGLHLLMQVVALNEVRHLQERKEDKFTSGDQILNFASCDLLADLTFTSTLDLTPLYQGKRDISAHLEVAMFVCDLVQVQQGLVDGLLQL